MRPRTLATALVASLAITVPSAAAAAAHVVERAGPYTVAIGWLHEPAYVAVDNAVQAIVKDASGHSVDDVPASDFAVTVSAAGQTSPPLPMNASFDPDTGLGTPGEYTAHLIPTAPGPYTFHVVATIHGTKLDVTETSSDTTFDSIIGQADAQFPAKLPSEADLAALANRLGERVQIEQAAVADAQSRADRALLVGAVAGGLGVALGLTAIGLALAARRRRA
ncbi:MAG TPA: hypothetical protein VEY67_11995 [Candidatus Dormibacteraeota bacterium]|nr:hypothetical protein [Candidatus Dormibacteraeota bacterium]